MPGRIDTSGGGGDSAGPRAHVELSEITLNSVGGEFIELVNPTIQPVDLTNYYVADIGEYWQLPMAAPNVANTDFIAQFPAGASLAPGAVATISISAGGDLHGRLHRAPTSLDHHGQHDRDCRWHRADADRRRRVVVLFSWDRTADLVKDVDIMIAGSPSAANGLMPSKSGVTQGAATYATDANTMPRGDDAGHRVVDEAHHVGERSRDAGQHGQRHQRARRDQRSNRDDLGHDVHRADTGSGSRRALEVVRTDRAPSATPSRRRRHASGSGCAGWNRRTCRSPRRRRRRRPAP